MLLRRFAPLAGALILVTVGCGRGGGSVAPPGYADAGHHDSGISQDAGVLPTDSGYTPYDAGYTPYDAGHGYDAGSPGFDAGPTVMGGVGSACTTGDDCTATGPGAACLDMLGIAGTGIALPGGYCSTGCTAGMADSCPSGAGCLNLITASYCLKTCTTAADCRSGYTCLMIPLSTAMYCLPGLSLGEAGIPGLGEAGIPGLGEAGIPGLGEAGVPGLGEAGVPGL